MSNDKIDIKSIPLNISIRFLSMSSNTRIKRKRELREVYIPQNAFIFQLPDETLLTIFKDLSIVDLIHAAGLISFFCLLVFI